MPATKAVVEGGVKKHRPYNASKILSGGGRWTTDAAPGKTYGRRHCIETVEQCFSKYTFLQVLSLPGTEMLFEHMIADRYKRAEFDLIERDEGTFDRIVPKLDYEYKSLGLRATLHRTELLRFVRHLVPDSGHYSVTSLDFVGGWCLGYQDILDELFTRKLARPGSLIFLTYNLKATRDTGKTQVHRVLPDNLAEFYSMDLLWEERYHDSADPNHNHMRLMAFRVRHPNEPFKLLNIKQPGPYR